MKQTKRQPDDFLSIDESNNFDLCMLYPQRLIENCNVEM
jgi:hypothetical protein